MNKKLIANELIKIANAVLTAKDDDDEKEKIDEDLEYEVERAIDQEIKERKRNFVALLDEVDKLLSNSKLDKPVKIIEKSKNIQDAFKKYSDFLDEMKKNLKFYLDTGAI